MGVVSESVVVVIRGMVIAALDLEMIVWGKVGEEKMTGKPSAEINGGGGGR